MQSVSTIGLDIAKSVFQVHDVDGTGQVVIRRRLKRQHVLTFFQKLSPCLVGIEACASSHHWSHRRSDARIVENGFATRCGVNKSAKVVLGLRVTNESRRRN